MKITEFFKNDYVDQASYDNLRKVASLVDGQKNAARKVLYTVLEKNIKDEIKVKQLGSKAAEFAEYLHGDLDGVIINLAQNFPGTNNIPLLVNEGNFGKRFTPAASASRYIFTHGSDKFFELFKKEDSAVLKHQFFEGVQIEPMFYVPTLPILLVNGSEGVSSGFAQKILPRNPDNLKKYIHAKINGKTPKSGLLVPFYNGFNGVIEQGDNTSQWIIKGVATQIGVNKVHITEVPVGYNLKNYINILDDLEEKKIIQSYRDKSENDKFEFEVTIPSSSLKLWSNDQLLEKLKLIKRISENYTVMDENNKIMVCDSAEQIIEKYIEIKLEYMQKRKDYLIKKYNDDIQFDYSKFLFIKMIVEDQLKINKRKKVDIITDLKKIKDIIQRDDSYDYLMNMNIMSLTKERMDKLEQDIKIKKQELDKLIKKSVQELWVEDMK